MTPDLLKGQQELSQQTHEETAKQILFSYLKDGSVTFSVLMSFCNRAQLNPDQSTNLKRYIVTLLYHDGRECSVETLFFFKFDCLR